MKSINNLETMVRDAAQRRTAAGTDTGPSGSPTWVAARLRTLPSCHRGYFRPHTGRGAESSAHAFWSTHVQRVTAVLSICSDLGAVNGGIFRTDDRKRGAVTKHTCTHY